MRVTQRLDYALRVLVALARRGSDGPAVAGDLARALGLPRRFVEQQVTALARAGLVTCRRGAGGGCVLARPAGEITVADVVIAIEGGVLDVPRTSGSAAAEMWAEAAERLSATLGETSLRDLADRQASMDVRQAAMYHI